MFASWPLACTTNLTDWELDALDHDELKTLSKLDRFITTLVFKSIGLDLANEKIKQLEKEEHDTAASLAVTHEHVKDEVTLHELMAKDYTISKQRTQIERLKSTLETQGSEAVDLRSQITILGSVIANKREDNTTTEEALRHIIKEKDNKINKQTSQLHVVQTAGKKRIQEMSVMYEEIELLRTQLANMANTTPSLIALPPHVAHGFTASNPQPWAIPSGYISPIDSPSIDEERAQRTFRPN